LPDTPPCASVSRYCVEAVPFCVRFSASRTSWICVRWSHSVVTTAVPMLPESVRKKLDRPEAAAMREGCTPDSRIWLIGTKKNATATPCTRRGQTMWLIEVSRSNVENHHAVSPNTTNASDAPARRSKRWLLQPTSGEQISAKMPTGAVAMPAQVGV
jgi:hypothetical protein